MTEHIALPVLFIINLEHRKDRWASISSTCQSKGFTYSRIEAFKHEIPWIGCAMSHLRCIEIAKEKGLPWTIILEDDAELDWFGMEQFHALLPHLWFNRDCRDMFNGGPHFGTGTNSPNLVLYDKHFHLFYCRGYAANFTLINSCL